ncbi:hypothetical protein MRB53_028504 [Persea americana]|uniref:Uncharacterized protein n=1 Tax=Persea americana TaxID=3435 RepID=A0ACC2KG80_PERAE|nr:hypothetical protein MRB53_028504 [Persea americana]
MDYCASVNNDLKEPVFMLNLDPALLPRRQAFSYVVYLGGHSHHKEASSIDYELVTDSHYEFLGSFLGSKDKAREAIFYSYQKHINGFAVNLEEEKAAEISKHPDVISVFLNQGRKLHTTRSWKFLGIEGDGVIPPKTIWHEARFGEDTIIGNLDSGVWPESESFRDEGMAPIPSKWKGICQFREEGLQCNRKLIGARYFNAGYKSAAGSLNASFPAVRDTIGHGTHTLSTAGGRFVTGANIFGYANGTAKGGAPSARVAAYKVCWPLINGTECFDADILAGFDAAIHDGVHVLSVSIGGDTTDYFNNAVAIGSFHAVRNRITVVCSAGNSGPTPGSVSNVAPWILTVGASTIDREITSYVELGNNNKYMGQSLSSKYLPKKMYPLISSVDAKAANATNEDAQVCLAGSLDPTKVKGKVVVCVRGKNERVGKGYVVLKAGGVGMVLVNDEKSGNEVEADAHVLPSTHVTAADGLSVLSYIHSTKSPTAYITHPITQLATKPAPFMAAFSSQGPNQITPEILKPDITAPGVSILAAYSQASSPSGLSSDRRRVPFSIQTGTSMSCPHISGIAALLKTLHPNWSPAAIRSAMMTTSRSRDNLRNPINNAAFVKATPFSYGAGHVRPNRAMDPGLVYDLTIDDYMGFLCFLGYDSSQMVKFTGGSNSCPEKKPSLLDFNYPSITVPNFIASTNVTRRVRNVGSPATYMVRVEAPKGVFISVEPMSLKFEKLGEEKTFTVTLVPKKGGLGGDYVFGRLLWSDGVHYVRSPIVVK